MILLVTVTSKLFNISQFSVLLSSTICNFCEKDTNLKERQSVICIPMNEFSHCLVESLFNRLYQCFPPLLGMRFSWTR